MPGSGHCSASPHILFRTQGFEQNILITRPNTCSQTADTNTCSKLMKQPHLEYRTSTSNDEQKPANKSQRAIRTSQVQFWSILRIRTTVREHPNTVHKLPCFKKLGLVPCKKVPRGKQFKACSCKLVPRGKNIVL